MRNLAVREASVVQAGLALALVVLTALAVAAERHGGGAGLAPGIITVLSVLMVGAILLGVVRRRALKMTDRSGATRAAAVALCLLAVVVTAVSLVSGVDYPFHAGGLDSHGPSRSRSYVPYTPASHAPTGHHADGTANIAAIGALLLLTTAMVAWLAYRARPSGRHIAAPSVVGDSMSASAKPPEDVLADALRAGRVAAAAADVDRMEPRAAIIACYRAMDATLGTRVGRTVADAPSELLTRIRASEPQSAAAATTLVELFQEARFSTHPMNATQWGRAHAALDLLSREHAGR